jgi:hypothetical protein
MLAVLPLAVGKARLPALRPAPLRMRRPICWPVGNSLPLRRVFARRLESNCCRTPQQPRLHLPCGAKLRKMNTYATLARNSSRMNTCAKTKGGTPSLVLRTILSSTANHSRINTYAIAAAKYRRMCSYGKSRGGGRVSGRFAGFRFLETSLSQVKTYGKLADNSCRMCTCEPLGPQPSLESTLAKKTGWGPPTDGFFRP